MKKNLLVIFVLLFTFSHAPLAFADTLNVCDSSYPDATYQTYISSSGNQQTTIKQTISEAIQTEQAMIPAQPDTSAALSGLYGQLEATFQTSVATLKKKNGVITWNGNEYDMTKDYENLVVQQLQTLGQDGVGTRFITSDYQSAIATLGPNTPITEAYNKAIATTNAINTPAVSSAVVAVKACISQLESLQQRLSAVNFSCLASAGYRTIQRNGTWVCISTLEYCRDTLGGAGIANSDGSCGVSCPSGYAYASSTQSCIPASPTLQSSSVPAPSTISPTVLSAPQPTTIQKMTTAILPVSAKVSRTPTREPAKMLASTTQSISVASTSSTTLTAITPIQVSHPSFWVQFFHVLNPFSWFR